MRVGMLAGEKSADNLGAAFMRDFQKLVPDVTFVGSGGAAMARAGMNSLSIEFELFGLVEVIRHIPSLLRSRRRLIDFFIEHKIDLFVGIDLPDFNIGIEEALHKRGIVTVHYVSPTVWAWRRKRTVRFLKANDLILCLYPFEPAIYGSSRSVFVGHPMADSIPDKSPASEARAKLDLGKWIAERQVMALLPGSRNFEIKRLLPSFVSAANLCHEETANLCMIVSAANLKRRQQIEALLAEMAVSFDYKIVTGKSREVIASADQVLVASGTATLETMLIKRPMVIAYRVHSLTAWLMRRMFASDFGSLFGQPNLLAGRKIVPEFIQSEVKPANLARACLQQIEQDTGKLYDTYAEIHMSLQRPTGVTPAQVVLDVLQKKSHAYGQYRIAGASRKVEKRIHRAAIVAKSARIADDVIVGPFCYIGENVEIGSGSRLSANVVVRGPARIGRNNHFFQYVCIGSSAQNYGLEHDDNTGSVLIGDNNVFHECSSVNRGLPESLTVIGSDNLIMSYCHFAHNCHVGNHNVVVNGAQFADSVHVAHHCNIAAGALVLSRCHIGSYSMIGARCVLRKDVPAFTLVTVDLAKANSIAMESLKSKNFSDSVIKNLQQAFTIFYLKKKTVPEALEAIRRECDPDEFLHTFLSSLDSGKRTVIMYEADGDIL